MNADSSEEIVISLLKIAGEAGGGGGGGCLGEETLDTGFLFEGGYPRYVVKQIRPIRRPIIAGPLSEPISQYHAPHSLSSPSNQKTKIK